MCVNIYSNFFKDPEEHESNIQNIYIYIYIKIHMSMCKDPEQYVPELTGTCIRTDQEHMKLSTRAHERTHRNTRKDPQDHA
jgi:hypothetical protein